MKILIIEDDKNIVDLLHASFQVGWPEVHLIHANNGQKGLEFIETQNPEVVLLDLGLPDIDGFELLKQIRKFSTIPIIILTVYGEETHIVRGLTLGANDYVVKPFRPLELIARLKALTKKGDIEQDLDLTVGNLRFGNSLCDLFKGDQLIRLTTIESHILYKLMKNASKVVTYSDLAEIAFGAYYPGAQYSLKTHINHIRKKIEDNMNHPQIIHNKRGIGYILTNPHKPEK